MGIEFYCLGFEQLGRKILEDIMSDEKLMEETVKHWDDIIERIRDLPVFSEDCPLCKKYHQDEECSEKCPIVKDTGIKSCKGTPWAKVYMARSELASAALDFRKYLIEIKEKTKIQHKARLIEAKFKGEYCHLDCPHLNRRKISCTLFLCGLLKESDGRISRCGYCTHIFGE